MDYSINNQSQKKYLVTNNGVPTIFSLVSSSSPTKARLEITIAGNTTEGNQYITINNVTVTSTNILQNAKNNIFYVSKSTSYAENRLKAYYLTQALNATALVNDYNIYIDQTFISTSSAKVVLEAKIAGPQGNITHLDTNLESAYWTFKTINGSDGDELTNSRITIDVYADSSDSQASIKNGSTQVPSQHVIQLEKYFLEDEVKFDLSPVLRTLTNDGNTTQYRLIVSALKGTTYRKLYDISGMHCLNGYQVNQGLDYFACSTSKAGYILQNVSRGGLKASANNTVLYYTPNNKVFISLLSMDRSNLYYQVAYKDSALNTIETITGYTTPVKNIVNVEVIPIDNQAHYMDITITGIGTLRYKNILPVSYADRNDIQTVYWYNSYGGISHFTFTGKREEQRDVDRTTYTTSNLDYYKSGYKGTEVLTTAPTYTVTLTSHLMEKDAIYQIYDLNNAKTVWTTINNKDYYIIIDSIQQNEVQRDIYEITITYHYASNIL